MWDSMRFVKLLERLRDEAGGSLSMLGHQARLSTPHIAKLMGGAEPPYRSVEALAAGFPRQALEIWEASPYPVPSTVIPGVAEEARRSGRSETEVIEDALRKLLGGFDLSV